MIQSKVSTEELEAEIHLLTGAIKENQTIIKMFVCYNNLHIKNILTILFRWTLEDIRSFSVSEIEELEEEMTSKSSEVKATKEELLKSTLHARE